MSTKLNVKLITRNLADELVAGMQNASGIYIMTSFLMQSGVKLLAPHLKRALDQGAEVRVLAGDYLFVTEPEGLAALYELDPRLEARLWRSMGTSFHPKAYLFDYENGEGLLIVGSSNFSLSAFKLGMEWNLAMNAQVEPYTFHMALEQFMHNFYHPHTRPLNHDVIAMYAEEYRFCHLHNPELNRIKGLELEESGQSLAEQDFSIEAAIPATVSTIKPRPAQEAALEALDRTLEEQYDKAMVIMATGLGKTYLAGFFAQKFNRVLFVAHREEILVQARRSFAQILPHKSFGLYNGMHKEGEADCVFASIYTLGLKKHRESFSPEAFDLIVVDEFHHAAAQSYMSVIQHFKPQFLLGITATPDRLDGKDVYGLCDGNVAYQIRFMEAIRRQWLAPFHYFGVYDETDYTQIRWLGTHYDEEQLLAAQMKLTMAERIVEAWVRHKQTRTLCFCSSIRQADFLASCFRDRGVRAVSLHSGTVGITREEAIVQLTDGQLEMILTVDLFNEGVDIPAVDTLLFVRPTESLTVFTQQIGRGLRIAAGKTHCVIIDLIGNYRNADAKLSLFASEEQDQGVGKKNRTAAIPALSSDVGTLQLDTQVINLLEELSRKRMPRREQLHWDFLDLKNELGRLPTYLELHLQGRADSREYRFEFGSLVGFLSWGELLSERESLIYHKYESWLRDVEETEMAKSYKMIVLLYMLERGADHWTNPVTPQEVAVFFYNFLMEKEYRKRIDFSDKKSMQLWSYNALKVSQLIASMPMSKWGSAMDGMTRFENGVFSLNMEVAPEDAATLHRWTYEICLYRLHLHFERRERRG
ncbi:DEAD/DEAH box helicase family protein [Paenibacillus koleovorans]|uniref:DEAD/DEAH box helicase family protein n=1 Tax=Paenibacillus koleovorans TaxID=121608 RepID=UPI000FD94EED|nr:DEAD/DEAH box helicase family protein [Paenibacillus koleovorans]